MSIWVLCERLLIWKQLTFPKPTLSTEGIFNNAPVTVPWKVSSSNYDIPELDKNSLTELFVCAHLLGCWTWKHDYRLYPKTLWIIKEKTSWMNQWWWFGVKERPIVEHVYRVTSKRRDTNTNLTMENKPSGECPSHHRRCRKVWHYLQLLVTPAYKNESYK